MVLFQIAPVTVASNPVSWIVPPVLALVKLTFVKLASVDQTSGHGQDTGADGAGHDELVVGCDVSESGPPSHEVVGQSVAVATFDVSNRDGGRLGQADGIVTIH